VPFGHRAGPVEIVVARRNESEKGQVVEENSSRLQSVLLFRANFTVTQRDFVKRALISDIHGNLEALQAVLADIDAQGVNEI